MRPEQLIRHARQAREHAYAPYSRFRVGAAVLTRDGRVFHGCNVENASYSLCNCAERTALFNAVAAGVQPGEFAHIAIVGDTEDPVSPCGACRQVMAELAGDGVPVSLGSMNGKSRSTTVDALLPNAFELDPRPDHALTDHEPT